MYIERIRLHQMKLAAIDGARRSAAERKAELNALKAATKEGAIMHLGGPASTATPPITTPTSGDGSTNPFLSAPLTAGEA